METYKQFRFDSGNSNKYIPKNVYKAFKKIETIDKQTDKIKKEYKPKIDKYSNKNRDNIYKEESRQFSKHIANKSETSLVESVNSLIRHYLARFNRKTKRYSKGIEMIEYSLYLLFDKLYWGFVVRQYLLKVSNANRY